MEMKINLRIFIFFCHIFFVIATSSLFHVEMKKYSAVPVDGVEGKSSQLPCNMTAAPKDSVYLVLWFKEGHTTPIYSYDVRELLGGEPKHWWDADLLGSRAFFNAHTNPAHLLLRHITPKDAGLFKCRVDFQREPTRNYRVNLTVIVPPKELLVYDDQGKRIYDVIGPIAEGSDLQLYCIAKGGSPPPEVVWLIDGKMFDDVEEENEPNLVRNDVNFFSLERSKIDSRLVCQAKYHPTYPPLIASVTLQMYLRPLFVNIDLPDEPLSAGKSYEFVCTSSGSKPPVTLSWWIANNRIVNFSQENLNNLSLSRSVVKLEARSSLNGQLLSCKAHNRLIASGGLIHTDVVLDIYFSPKVEIDTGSASNPTFLQEGDSIYLNCLAEANPPPYKIIWRRNEITLTRENFGHSVLSNWSLLLQNIGPQQEGNYSCVASNVEGDGHSEPFLIRVKHRPHCLFAGTKVLIASIGEPLQIPCNAKGFPQPSHYEWLLDTSKNITEIVDRKKSLKRIRPPKYRRNRGKDTFNKDELTFIPQTDSDFGTVLCYAKNQLGRQDKPCVYRIVTAALPLPPVNCSIRDVTASAVSVQCSANETDRNQTFILRIFSVNPLNLLSTLTSATPRFRVQGLDADTVFAGHVLARNTDGDSEVEKVPFRTKKPPVKQLETRLGTDGRADKSSSSSLVAIEAASFLGALIGGVAVFIIIITIAVYTVKKNKNSPHQKRGTASSSSGAGSPSMETETLRCKVSSVETKPKSELTQQPHKYEELHQQEDLNREGEDMKIISILATRDSEQQSFVKKKNKNSEFTTLGNIEERSRVRFQDISPEKIFQVTSLKLEYVDNSVSGEDLKYIRPLSPGSENEEIWTKAFSSEHSSGSQTLPSRMNRMKKKRGSTVDDIETRPPDLVSCSSSPPSPAPQDLSSSLCNRSESLLLGELVETVKPKSFSLLSKRESIV